MLQDHISSKIMISLRSLGCQVFQDLNFLQTTRLPSTNFDAMYTFPRQRSELAPLRKQKGRLLGKHKH